MKIQIETSSYNDRRYGKPWIARVSFEDSKGDFDFGAWVGQPGSEGLLELDAEPGDVIARGQKDFRKPSNSAPDYYILLDDGSLGPTSKADAYKHFQAQQAASPDREALRAERDRLLQRLAEIDAQLAN